MNGTGTKKLARKKEITTKNEASKRKHSAERAKRKKIFVTTTTKDVQMNDRKYTKKILKILEKVSPVAVVYALILKT